jgi:GH24 family phage-related lysozyme (muramidase)
MFGFGKDEDEDEVVVSGKSARLNASTFFAFSTKLFSSLKTLSDIRDDIERVEISAFERQQETAQAAAKIAKSAGMPEKVKPEEGSLLDKLGLFLAPLLGKLLSFLKFFGKIIKRAAFLLGKFVVRAASAIRRGLGAVARGFNKLSGRGKLGVFLAGAAVLGGALAWLKSDKPPEDNDAADKADAEADAADAAAEEAEAAEFANMDMSAPKEEPAQTTGGGGTPKPSSPTPATGASVAPTTAGGGGNQTATAPAPARAPAAPAGTPTQSPSQSSTGTAGTPTRDEFTMKKEGFVPNIYKDIGVPTIGYGHRLKPDELASKSITLSDGSKIDISKGITKEQGKKIYDDDRASHDKGATDQLKKLGIDLGKLNQPTKDALNDLAFNAGSGIFAKSPKLVAALKAGDLNSIAKELRTTGRTAGGKTLAGLEKRADERANMVLASASSGPSARTQLVASTGDMDRAPGQVYIQPIIVEHRLKAA